jgi:ABC-2 type transport system permease protein
MPWILFGITMLVAFIMLIVLVVVPGAELPLQYHQYAYTLQLPLALFVASRAPYAVSRDLRDGVMPLYLSRPLTSRDYVIAKFCGLATGVLVFALAPITLLLIGALLAKLPVGDQLTGWLAAAGLAIVLSVLITAIGLAIASFMRRRGIGVAAIITVLLLTNGLAGVFSAILSQREGDEAAGYMVALNPFALVDGMGAALFGLKSGNDQPTPTGVGPGLVLLAVYLALVALCFGVLLRRYRAVGARG